MVGADSAPLVGHLENRYDLLAVWFDHCQSQRQTDTPENNFSLKMDLDSSVKHMQSDTRQDNSS